MPNNNVSNTLYGENVCDKITATNWKYDGIQSNHSEFFNKIRNSDAWFKHWAWMSMTNKEVAHLTPSRYKTSALRDYHTALRNLIKELDEVESYNCEYIVTHIIAKDHSCLKDEPPVYSLGW